MLPKKLVLPATCLLILGAVGCSSSAHRVDSDEYGYRVESTGAVDNSMTRYNDIENRNTTVSDNALRSERLESRYEEPIYSHNTTVFDNALNRGDSVEGSYRTDIRSDVRSDRDVLVSEDSSLRSDADVSVSSQDSSVAGTTTTTTTSISESESAPGSYNSMYNQGAAPAAGAAAGVSASEKSDGRVVANAAASQANAYNFVEISFEPGSTGLTESAKSSLRSVVDQAKSAGKLDEAIVLSWSDEEYPAKEVKKLPKYQRDLADNRNKAVKDFIKSVQKMDIDTYNMASQPNVVSKWFNTTDARLKNSLSAAGLPTTADQQQYPSKASHSLVLIKVE